MVHQSELDPYEQQLCSSVRRERESAAEQISDYLQYAELSLESKLKIGSWLIDAIWRDNDEVVLESLLHALGWINFGQPCPGVPWKRLGEYLPKLQTPLLGEYALATLGECGDPSMVSYIEPYLRHSEESVRLVAGDAISQLNSRT